MPVIVGPSTITINHNNRFVIAQPDASMAASDDVGFFAQDTRFVSAYSITINGRVPVLLNAARVEHFSVRHEFTTPELPLGTGLLGSGGLASRLAPSDSASTGRSAKASTRITT